MSVLSQLEETVTQAGVTKAHGSPTSECPRIICLVVTPDLEFNNISQNYGCLLLLHPTHHLHKGLIFEDF